MSCPDAGDGRPGTGVSAAAGVVAAGVSAGLKSSGGLDVALIVVTGPQAAAAGVFTSNRVVAAPVQWSRQVIRGGQVRAVVLNSGGANACTGADGFADTHATAEAVARVTGVDAGEVAVCSTGVIGQRLDLGSLLAALPRAAAELSPAGGTRAAEAIRTTDTVRKEAVRRIGAVTIGGMAKGAAMLSPALATMLAVITTDAVADADQLDRLLRAATSRTFDRVDTDGCCSTNDTVLLIASGASGVRPAEADLAAAVEQVCADLAGQMVADAEGAGKDITVEVLGAQSTEDALTVARAVARNTLVKCALAGSDPYWGRILAAAGTTAAFFDPDRIDVSFNGVRVCRGGCAQPGAPAADISGRRIHVEVELHAGTASAAVHTTDLTTDYVHLNADYTT